MRRLGIRGSVAVPIQVDGRVWGISVAASQSPEPFPPATETRIVEFTELVATAISNAHSRAELATSRAGHRRRRREPPPDPARPSRRRAATPGHHHLEPQTGRGDARASQPPGGANRKRRTGKRRTRRRRPAGACPRDHAHLAPPRRPARRGRLAAAAHCLAGRRGGHAGPAAHPRGDHRVLRSRDDSSACSNSSLGRSTGAGPRRVARARPALGFPSVPEVAQEPVGVLQCCRAGNRVAGGGRVRLGRGAGRVPVQ